MRKNKHIGSTFDDFLQEEGLLAEAEATAVKRVIAHQIEKEMAERHISKSALARSMRTSRSSLDRLLDPKNASVTLLTLESVALALGKKLRVRLASSPRVRPRGGVGGGPSPTLRRSASEALGR